MGQRFKKAPVAAAICGSLLLVALGSAHAQSATCRSLIGFNSLLAEPLAPATGAWLAVQSNAASFLGNRDVDTCEVKVVTGPRAKTSATIYEAGPMNQNQCSLFNGLSSLDSKLAQGKNADAYKTVTSMIGRIDGWASTAKLVDPGYAAIRNATVAVQSCIAAL